MCTNFVSNRGEWVTKDQLEKDQKDGVVCRGYLRVRQEQAGGYVSHTHIQFRDDILNYIYPYVLYLGCT